MYTTDAIVISVKKNTDTTSLVHLYTRSNGHILCVVYGRKGTNRNRRRGISLNLIVPLSWLDVQLKAIPNKNLFILNSATYHYIPKNIYLDVKRQCIALFISEVLYKTLIHPMADEQLYNFITRKIVELDTADSVEYIYDSFLTEFSIQLGYGGEPIEEWKTIHSTQLFV